MLARIFRRLFENEGAGPKLRDDIVPWGAVPWENGPIATPGRAGFVPAGGLPGQALQTSDDGQSYTWGKNAAAGAIVGAIDLLPFRVADLAACAPGWHFCNGDLYPLESAVGAALAALPENFKSDWRIIVSGANISIPNMFHTDGRGYFIRAVGGTTRLVGTPQEDAMQNLTGYIDYNDASVSSTSGVFSKGANNKDAISGSSGTGSRSLYFNSSTSPGARTADENRSLNIGMTPAIFLGV